MTAFNPDPQTFPTVVQGVCRSSPPPRAACLAGAWPTPAVRTQPMKTSSILPGSTTASFMVARMLVAPSCVALI